MHFPLKMFSFLLAGRLVGRRGVGRRPGVVTTDRPGSMDSRSRFGTLSVSYSLDLAVACLEQAIATNAPCTQKIRLVLAESVQLCEWDLCGPHCRAFFPRVNLGSHRNHFCVALGSLWCQCGIMWGHVRSTHTHTISLKVAHFGAPLRPGGASGTAPPKRSQKESPKSHTHTHTPSD